MPVPPDLVHASAHELIAAFTERSISPVEVLDALIDHVERHEPTINAVADRRFDEARVEAAAAADRYLGRSGGPRPLEGVPVAVKEEHPMIGRSWTQGSFAEDGVIATEDHPVVGRLHAAGAVMHLRTTTPEYCCAAFCHSPKWGITRNPWNPSFSPGGSSGGSGAALAAGYAPLATGSDIGGSIRIPASLSGVVGLKPAWGRVPALPPYNLDQYCHDGPMARTVDDLRLMTSVLFGADPRDHVASHDAPDVSALGSFGAGGRVAMCLRLGDWPLAPDVEANTLAVGDALRSAGVEVVEVELPWTVDDIWRAATAHFATIMGPGIAAVERDHGDVLADYTRQFVATMHAELTFYEGLTLEGHLWRPLGALFEEYDAVVCPTMATDGYVAGESYLSGGLSIGEGHVHHSILGAMTLPFNMFSRCPVISVPSGRAANGVPTGVQVVGRPYDEPTAFALAATIERLGFGWSDLAWRPTLS
jgi:aspartyl-tRNA(Asn)/glutamyl-tRNA(Gln) amidotransferase subunit A